MRERLYNELRSAQNVLKKRILTFGNCDIFPERDDRVCKPVSGFPEMTYYGNVTQAG